MKVRLLKKVRRLYLIESRNGKYRVVGPAIYGIKKNGWHDHLIYAVEARRLSMLFYCRAYYTKAKAILKLIN